MANEPKDEAPAASAEEWPKRAPPTIDLDASDVSGDTRAAGSSFKTAAGRLSSGSMLAKCAAPASGAIAALLVFTALWAGGLIGPPQAPAPLVSPTQFDNVAANVGDLTARLARVESSVAKPAAATADPALAGRTEALAKSLADARDELARVAAQLRSVTTSVSDLKTEPRDGASVPDLGPFSERLTRLEDATRTLSTALAKPAAASADDLNVRRLVVANMLDGAVRRGEPFAAALATAKQVATPAASLTPLDAFAAKGIPAETTYLREIVPILQRIAVSNSSRSPSAEGGGVLERLQSGFAKLVRYERDAGPRDGPATPPALAAGVRRDDLTAAKQDVAKLPQSSDPQIQAWIKSVDAREAALAASQKFSSEALAAFGKSGQ